MSDSSRITPLIGRILMAVIFLISGSMKVAVHAQFAGYAAAKGLPMADFAIWAAAALEVIGGLAILVGFRARIFAWLLFLYLIPTTFLFHNFWAQTGMEQQNNMTHFLKNIAIMGGLLLLASHGAGGYSVDASRSRSA